MANLFERKGLEQDTGLLKQRWGQDGSEVINISDGLDGDATLHTVTAGKTLYINSIFMGNSDGNAGTFQLKDGGSGGTRKFSGTMSAVKGDNAAINLNTPLKFETDVYFDETADETVVQLTLTGWEE